jgi:hypothetical protein
MLSVTHKQCASLEEEQQQLQLHGFLLFSLSGTFFLCASLGEGALSWLSIGYGVASWNHSFYQRLRCSGVVLCLWLGDNGVAFFMVKRAHQHYSNNVIPSGGSYPNAGWYATPTQASMLPQHRLVCYSNACWYATPVQVGMLLQRKLVYYSNAGWYVTPTHVSILP